MAARVVQTVVCPACGVDLDAGDQFCRHCGMPASLRYASGGQLAWEAARRDPLESRWVVVGLLFVLGPLAFPLLYRSRAFRWPAKWALAVVVMAIAVVAIWVTMYLIGRASEPLRDTWEQMHGMP